MVVSAPQSVQTRVFTDIQGSQSVISAVQIFQSRVFADIQGSQLVNSAVYALLESPDCPMYSYQNSNLSFGRLRTLVLQ